MSLPCRVLKNGKYELTQGYHNNHKANDIVGAGYTLDYIVAHSDGVVDYYQDGYINHKGASGMESYGNMIRINHGDGYQTLYAHMQKGLNVKMGQNVKKGDILGYMSDSGNAYGGHLHFEVIHNGERIAPDDLLNANLPIKKDEIPNYTYGYSTLELAKKVIRGDFGNGEQRKELLGDKYNEVQTLVNKMLLEDNDNDYLLDLVKKTIRGDFGNGDIRKSNLGTEYDRVQEQVNLNYQNGTTNWDNIRLY